MTPPLLPTLMMAVILGAGSYLCHEPAAPKSPAPALASTALASAVVSAPETVAEAPFIPASLAFQTQFPMIVAAQAEPAPPAQAHRVPARPARLAVPRRAESSRMAARTLDKAPPAFDKAQPALDKAATPDRPLPFAAEAEEPGTVAASDESVLPEIALPFAPTIRAVTQASAAAGAFVGARGAALGAETASLGAAVSSWVGRLR